METLITMLAVRFAVVVAVIAVLALVGFAIVRRLRRRGQWEQTRERLAPVVTRAARHYGDQPGQGAGRAITRATARAIERKTNPR